MNDWIVAGINNPDFTVSDFKNIADLSIKDTQMLKKEDYLKSNFIKNNDLFKDANGKFSKDKFDSFYNQKLKEFQDFSTNNFYDGPDLDTFSTFRTAKSTIKDHGFDIGLKLNPDRQRIGIEGVNVWSDPTMSKQEIAQSQKVWNSEKQQYEDYRPDDHSLFSKPLEWIKDLFRDPLVMAQYDEDTVDPITGEKHKKGDYKLNDEGTYYYETLNGRSPVGKETLSVFDILTSENSAVNKYDFFDSDDIEKSIGGVIAKNVVTLAPLFLGGPWATAQSAFLISREMSKSLPMLYDMTTSILGSEKTPDILNSIAGIGYKFTSGNSQYAKEHQLSFENLASMITDVALQWGQQKQIAKSINQLRGTKNYIDEATKNAQALYLSKINEFPGQVGNPAKWWESDLGKAALKKFMPEAERMTESATKLGRDMSLAYMSIISNSDVFQEAVNMGVSRQGAAAIALGSTLGMFAVDKTGLGELMFDDATDDAVKAARKAIKQEIFGSKDGKTQGARQVFESIANSKKDERFKLVQMMKTAADTAKGAFNKFSDDIKYHSTNLAEKMIGEGVEEVSEELVTDAAKGIYELAGKLGFDTNSKDIGAWDNALERYGMSFLGGALGGGVFYGKEVWDGKSFKTDKANEELVTLIRNGHTQELYDELEKVRESGKAGSKELSAYDYEVTDDNKKVWLSAKNAEESQNEKISDLIREKITAIDAILNNNQVNLNDDQLFQNMVLGEQRYARFQEIAPITNYYEDFNEVLNELIEAEANFKNAQKTLNGLPDGIQISGDSGATSLAALNETDKAQRIANLRKQEEILEEKRKAKDDFLSGKTSLDYTRKLNFALDPLLSDQFLPVSFQAYWEQKHKDKAFSDATDEEKQTFLDEYSKRKGTPEFKKELTLAWEKYKEIEQLIAPELANFANPEFKQWYTQWEKIKQSGKFDFNKYRERFITYDSKLDGESDYDYNNRNQKIVRVNESTGKKEFEESDADFQLRKNLRNIKIEEYNNVIRQEFVDSIKDELSKVNGNVDSNTALWITQQVDMRLRDALNFELAKHGITKTGREIYKKLKPDLSNASEIIDEIMTSVSDNFKDSAFEEIRNFKQIEVDDIYEEESKVSLYDLISSKEEVTLQDALDGEFETEMNAEDYAKFYEELQTKIAPLFDGDTSLAEILNKEDYDSVYGDDKTKFDKAIEDFESAQKNSHQGIINSIKSNPIYDLKNSLKETIKNPINQLIDKIADAYLDKNKIQIPKIHEILQKVETDFQDLDDISDLELDPVQIEALNKTKDILALVSAYIHAASAQANTRNPIGHNKMINEFARNHKDLVENWDELPEIDEDYALVYQKTLVDYERRLEVWLRLSLDNTINKKAQFVKTDESFQNALFDYIITTGLKPKIDDKEWDLLAGADTSDPDTRLFNVEQAIYNNFNKALEESGLSLVEFLDKSGLFNIFNKFAEQKSAPLSGNMTANDLTDFDKGIYLAVILSLNPSDFYAKLKDKVTRDESTAPIVTQEYAQKIIVASLSQRFKDVISYLHQKSGDDKFLMAATVFINGVAGAGKTKVVIKSIKDYVDAKDILVCGPTQEQYKTLQKDLGIEKGYTIEEILKEILTENSLNGINDAIAKTKLTAYKVGEEIHYEANENDYFDVHEGSDQNIKYTLKQSAPINFKETAPKAKVLIIDEATHMNAVVAQVLNKYMESIGGTLILAGDTNQKGYSNGEIGLNNIEEHSVFAVRTPKLLTSLRDNNIQKQYNLNNTRAIIDMINSDLQNIPEAEFISNFELYKNLYSKLNFSAYVEDDINGDLIVPEINSDIKSKLQKQISKASTENPITIGFIGDPGGDTYNKIKEFNPKVLTEQSMQGQEFDYVIIDKEFKAPENSLKAQEFIRDLYTLMSRGKSGSIFIDKNLSSIIGKNKIENYKAIAPSIKDKINGKSAVDELRELKLAKLQKYKLTPSEEVKASTSKSEKNPDEIFIDPESRNDEASKKRVEGMENTDGDPMISGGYDESEWDVPIFSRASFISVQSKKDSLTGKDGTEYKGETWTVVHGDSELRNMQALYPDGYSKFWYRDKIEMQRQLNSVRSFILFNHDWDSTIGGVQRRPAILSNFNKNNWEKGEYVLEIRKPDGEQKPIQSPFKKIGLTYKDKDYIVELVFKVTNNDGKVCKFDLGGINDPATLKEKQSEIIDNLNDKINSGRYSTELVDKFKNIVATLPGQITQYENKFDEWINTYESEGKFELDVSDSISFDKVTYLVEGEYSHRLGGNIVPENFTTREVNGKTEIYFDKDVWSVRDMNPDMVISDVYTYGSATLEGVDPGIKGKAVVFVSSDMSIPANQLAQVYKEQKRDPDNHKPAVRMVVLDNYGMSMQELFSEAWVETFKKGLVGESKPYSQNYLGVQMFVSFWNWQVGLKQFNDAVTKWRSEKGYEDDAKLNAILEAENYLFEHPTTNKSEYLNSKGVSQSDIDNLNNFNQEICKNIPIFRLGFAKKNGFYIREFETDGSSVYDTSKSNCIVIDLNTASKFSKLLERFSQNLIGEFGLDVDFIDPDTKETWSKDKFIDIKSAKHRLSISGLFKKVDGAISISETNENGDTHNVATLSGEAWTAIPILFGNVLSKVNDYRKNPDKYRGDDQTTARTYWKDSDGVTHSHTMQIGDWFSGDDPLIKSVAITGSDVRDENGKIIEQKEDNTLIKMLSLMFHGTSDDFRKTDKKEHFARFPNGFFTHPATYSKEERAIIFNDSDVFYPIRTYEGLFSTKLEFRPAGLGLRLRDILNPEKKPEKKEVKDYHIPKQPSTLPENTKVTFQDQDKIEQKGFINSRGVLIPNIPGVKLYLGEDKVVNLLMYDDSGKLLIDGLEELDPNLVQASYIEGADEFDYGTIEEEIIDTHPVLTELSKEYPRISIDDEKGINFLIQKHFKTKRGSILNLIKTKLTDDNIDEMLDVNVSYKYVNPDIVEISLRDYLKNQLELKGDDSEVTISLNDDNLIINDSYVLNDDWELVKQSIGETSLFDTLIDEKPASRLLMDIINFDDEGVREDFFEFNQAIVEEREESDEYLDQYGKAFIEEINNIIEQSKKDENVALDMLLDLKKDDNFGDIIEYIREKNEELYKHLFECP